MKLAVIILFAIISLSESQKSLPPYIKACRRNDPNLNKCFARNANLAMKYIAKGDPEYGIKSLLPLNWNEFIQFSTPGLNFTYLVDEIYGAESLTIHEANIQLDKNSIKFNFTNQFVIWKCHYKATVIEHGQQVQKNGHVDFHFTGGKFLMSYKYDYHIYNGLKYAKITKFHEDVTDVEFDYKPSCSDKNGLSIKDWEKYKDKLFNRELLDAAAKLIGGYINKIFDVVPFNRIFTNNRVDEIYY